MKSSSLNSVDRIFTPEQEAAICWCADQQVALAIKHGTISITQAENHWFSVAQDLVDEPELLEKMVEGHMRSKSNARVTSTKVYQDYEAEKGSECRELGDIQAKPTYPRTTAIAGALVLAVAAPLTNIYTQSAFATPNSVMGSSNGSFPTKKEHELPPHRPPRVRHIVKKKKDEGAGPDEGRVR